MEASDSTTMLPLFLLSFIGYYAIERAVKSLIYWRYPKFYNNLHATGRLAGYVVFILGILITSSSTPVCAKAWYQSSEDSRQLSSNAAKICLISKALLWTAELNRLDFAAAYVVHHLASLISLVHHISFHLPVRPLFVIYTSLVTELLSNSAALVGYHKLRPENSRLAYVLHLVNYFALIFVRLPAVLYAFKFLRYFEWQDLTLWTSALSLVIYARTIIVTWVWTRTRTLKVIQRAGNDVILVQAVTISLYGIFFSFASIVTATVAGTIIHLALISDSTFLTGSSLPSLSKMFFYTGLVSLFGSRVPGLLTHHGLSSIFSPRRFLSARSGFSIQGGMLGGGLFLLFSPSEMININQRLDLLSAAAVASLFGEAIGRIGCYFAGCCGSSSHSVGHPKPQVTPPVTRCYPVPLIVTKMLIPLASIIVGLHLAKVLTLRGAGALALLGQATVRIYLSHFRNDVTNYMQILVYLQLIVSIVMFLSGFPASMPIPRGGHLGVNAKLEIQSLVADPWTGGLIMALVGTGLVTKSCS